MLPRLSDSPKLLSRLLLFILLGISLIHVSVAQARRIECTLEARGDQEFCVFRNVRLQKNEAGVTFGFPGSTAPSHVAFEKCSMAALPAEFWSAFGGNLRVLEAGSCGLASITVTNAMEVLRVSNNSISALTVQQGCNLLELDVSSNRFNNFQSIAKCNKLTTLNMNDNEEFASGNELDFSMFENQRDLKELLLSNVGVNYLDNTKNVGLPSLHTIDLSRNSIIPSDLKLEIFVPFSALETLKLNDNAMARLDYRELGNIPALKSVHLNGNSFKCDYLTEMLKVLHELNIDTPKDRAGNCQPNDRELDGMCCLGVPPPPVKPSPPPTQPTAAPPATPTPPTPRPDVTPTPTITTATPVTKSPSQEGKGSNTVWIIAVIVIVVLIAAAGGVFAWIRSKRRRQGMSPADQEAHYAMRSKVPTEEPL